MADAAKDIVPSSDERLGIGDNTSTDTKDVQVTSISGEEKLDVCKQTSPATEDSKVNWMLFEEKLNAHDDTSSDPQEVQVPSTSEATQQFGDETLRGNYKETLVDATVSVHLEPSLIKAIVKGEVHSRRCTAFSVRF